jgi:hypothetical protein
MDIKNCEEFIPNDNEFKCIADGDTCQLRNKECSDYGVDKCPNMFSSEYNCLPDLDKNMCIIKKCEDLSSTECDKFKAFGNRKKCVPEGEKCILKTCENLTVSECESFIFDDNNYKCIIDKNECKLSSCIELTGNCESFIPNIPLSVCKEDPSDGRCIFEMKKCEEMTNDLCDQWNEELKKDGYIPTEKCVKGEDKCKLIYEEDDEGQFGVLDSKQIFVLLLVGVVLLVLLLLVFLFKR